MYTRLSTAGSRFGNHAGTKRQPGWSIQFPREGLSSESARPPTCATCTSLELTPVFKVADANRELGLTVAGIGKFSAACGVVRPARGIDVWLSPYATIGACGGVNLLAWRERVLGVVLTYHARSLDGAQGGW
jgi:hypothetical protein